MGRRCARLAGGGDGRAGRADWLMRRGAVGESRGDELRGAPGDWRNVAIGGWGAQIGGCSARRGERRLEWLERRGDRWAWSVGGPRTRGLSVVSRGFCCFSEARAGVGAGGAPFGTAAGVQLPSLQVWSESFRFRLRPRSAR